MKTVELYTDGACSGNPGVGGWAAILTFNGYIKKVSGHDKLTTNNRMEVFAIIQGIAQLKEPCIVNVYSDSAYAVNAFNKGWVQEWMKNGWKNAKNDPVKNQDLWNDLLLRIAPHQVHFIKVKGHSDHVYNNLCDEMAKAEIKNYQSL